MTDQEFLRSPNAPENLPTNDEVVASCDKAGYNRNGVAIYVAGSPHFWVKYGGYHIKGEGLTQAHVATIVNNDAEPIVRVPEVYAVFSRGTLTYIVMEFVRGTTVAESEPRGYIKAVAAAVQRLTQIKVPSATAPGPIGGGPIGNNFFVEALSTLTYPSVEYLQAHINRVLALVGAKGRVDFGDETKDGLVLCPWDLDPSNFMIHTSESIIDGTEGVIWAIDFGGTCFLPPSFLYYSFKLTWNPFARRVLAAYQMIVRGSNTFGKPKA